MATCGREIHYGDIGTAIRVTLYDCEVLVDLTGATTTEFIFKKPDFSTTTVTASFYLGDPALGVLEYLTIADDLDQVGQWELQAHIALPTGEWWSDTEKFRVYANL